MSSYVELHCHSAFSLLDGASHPEALVERACTLGYQALALTDRDDLGGIVCFAQAAQNAGIEGIVGAEVTVREAGGGRRGSGVSGRRAESTARPCGFPTPDTLLPTPGRLTHNPPSSPLVLLAEAHEGYANLSTLITRARMDSPRGEPSVSIETLAAHARGLFALTGGPRGWVPRCIARGDLAGARDAAGTLLDIFDGRVAVECWDHRVQEERETVTHLIALAKSLGIPWVVANDVRYATAEERVVHDVLSALRHGKTLDDMGTRLHPNAEWCLKSPAQMLRRWRRHPEGIRATVAIAERCAFRLRELKPSLPAFPLPPGVTPDEYLARLVEQGAYERWGARGASRPDRRAQLAHELAMIRRLHLAGYFLIVWDIVRFAQREGILCQGRGSAANSAVCFCLGITPVDPIKLGLLFERFLSEERQEAPDIDIDFAHRERERVLQYVYERYGRDHAAMVCEQITYRGKSAVRDVARVLGDRDGERGERRKEKGGATSEERTRSRGPVSSLLSPFSSLPLRAPSLEPRIPDLLQQLPRHRSIHVGGFVLTEQPLSTIVPIEPASMENRTVIQWDKDDVDAVGLVKIDLLGLGMLTLIQDCLTYIRATRGHTVDLAELDYADQAVYDDLCRADTIGVFQVESRAQMQTLPRLKPRCFYDIVVEVALIRPGPIQGEMVHPYLRRKNGEEPVEYLHPALEPILARTLGVPLFQEQGMQVAIAAAGFTPGEADTLRRAMGHKRSRERMAALRDRLMQGMMRNGISEADAERIYKQLNGFADYGFPESHAASFALLVYASAYLRHYYAPEFTAAILNAQPMGFYSPGTIIEDARRHGVTVLPVDVTRSGWESTLEVREAESERGERRKEKGVGSREYHPHLRGRFSFLLSPLSSLAVRLGFRVVRGLGSGAKEKVERALRDGGPFRSIGDMVARSGLDRGALRALAEAGAFDALVVGEPNARRRRVAVWRMLEAFRDDAGPLAPSRSRPGVPAVLPAMSPIELTAADYRMTGISLNGHPMKHLRALLEPNGVRTAREVLAMRDGAHDVAMAGLVICRQRPHTAKGFVFLSLEDETGIVNVVVTPKRFERQEALISRERLLLVRGTLQVERGVVNLRGETFRALKAEVEERWGRGHDFH